jgi:hypothetical protein
MSCPYRDSPALQQLPCHYIQHPKNNDIYFCTACQQSYNIDDVGREVTPTAFPIGLLLTVVGVTCLSLILLTGEMPPPEAMPINPPSENSFTQP